MDEEFVLIFIRWKLPVNLSYVSSMRYCFVSNDGSWTIEYLTLKGYLFIKKKLLIDKEDLRISEIQLIKPKFIPAY